MDDKSHAVILRLKLTSGGFGSDEEHDAIHGMTYRLQEVLLASMAGEFDGDEFGGGECILFMYGPDADKLFSAIQPILKDWQALVGGYATKRYGPPGARSEKIDFILN
jgi:hypothetical protein